MQSLALYTSCLFSLSLNDNIVGIEKLEGLCLLTFTVDEYPGYSLHLSFFRSNI